MCDQAKGKAWRQTTFDVIVQVQETESSCCRVRGKEVDLNSFETRFVATLFLRRGHAVSYVELDHIVHTVSLSTGAGVMAAGVEAEALEKADAEAAKRKMQTRRSRLKKLPNGLVLDELIDVDEGLGYSIKPEVRFCLLLPVSREARESGESSRS